MCKRCPNICITLKKDLFWVFYSRGEQDKRQWNRFERGKSNKNRNLQCFPYTRCTLSFAFVFYLPFSLGNAWYVNASNAKLMSFNLPLNSISASFTPLPSTKMRLVVAPPNVNVPFEALTLICISCEAVTSTSSMTIALHVPTHWADVVEKLRKG